MIIIDRGANIAMIAIILQYKNVLNQHVEQLKFTVFCVKYISIMKKRISWAITSVPRLENLDPYLKLTQKLPDGISHYQFK